MRERADGTIPTKSKSSTTAEGPIETWLCGLHTRHRTAGERGVGMSIKATNFVRRLRRLSPAEKAVAWCIADHDDRNGGGCYVSMTTLAEEAGLKNRQTASEIVQLLENYKVIFTHHKSEGRNPTVWHYNYDLENCGSPIKVAPLNRNPRVAVNRSPGVAVNDSKPQPDPKATATLRVPNRNPKPEKSPPTATPGLQEGFRSKGTSTAREERTSLHSAAAANPAAALSKPEPLMQPPAYVGTAKAAPASEKILSLLTSAGSVGYGAKRLAQELYGESVHSTGRVQMIILSLRKKGHTIISQPVITKAGKEVRYVLKSPPSSAAFPTTENVAAMVVRMGNLGSQGKPN